jgi:hypothetical protein
MSLLQDWDGAAWEVQPAPGAGGRDKVLPIRPKRTPGRNNWCSYAVASAVYEWLAWPRTLCPSQVATLLGEREKGDPHSVCFGAPPIAFDSGANAGCALDVVGLLRAGGAPEAPPSLDELWAELQGGLPVVLGINWNGVDHAVILHGFRERGGFTLVRVADNVTSTSSTEYSHAALLGRYEASISAWTGTFYCQRPADEVPHGNSPTA